MIAQNIAEQMEKEIFKDGKPNVQAPSEVFQRLARIFPLRAIEEKKHHGLALAMVEKLITFLGVHELQKELCKEVGEYLHSLATLVEAYEKKAFPKVGKKVSGVEMLKFLMEQNGMKQSDLKKELGGQPNVSSVLKGVRKLNANQIAALAKRFHVSPAVFFE